MRYNRKIRRQKPVPGGRDPLPSCVVGQIKDRIDLDARRYGVSRSWVVASLLAGYYKIKIPDYR